MWNHRIVRHSNEHESWLSIHEVLYEIEGATLWTEDPVGVVGESIGELRITLERMLACLDKPIIEDTE